MADLEIRGIMLDPARLTERRKVYRDMIALYGQWGYNALFWHFTDNEGCALKFPSRPELGGLHAYDEREMRNFIRHADRHGLQVIPEVEALGHTGCITDLERYRHLRDGVPGKMFGAICPLAPETREILTDILTDTARIFPSPLIHVGLDEVGFGAHPITAKALRTRKKHEIFAEHICWLYELITSLGKRMMIWGDHLLGPPKGSGHLDGEAFSRDIAAGIPKDILICDWHYQPRPDPWTTDFFLAQGFEVVVCPSTMCWGSVGSPRTWNLRNLRDFIGTARARRGKGVKGVMNTVWTPRRNFPGATLYGAALGARLIRSGRVPGDFAEQFVTDVFGLSSPERTAWAVRRLPGITPHLSLLAKALVRRPCDWFEQTTAKDVRGLSRAARQAGEVAEALEEARPKVSQHKVYFDDLIFTARCFARAFAWPEAWASFHKREQEAGSLLADGQEAEARRKLKSVAADSRRLAREAEKLYGEGVRRWKRTRFEDDPKRDGIEPGSAAPDALVQRLRTTAEFASEMARVADEMATTLTGALPLPEHYPAL